MLCPGSKMVLVCKLFWGVPKYLNLVVYTLQHALMSRLKIVATLLLSLLVFNAGAQRIRNQEGSIDALRGVTVMNVQYTYDGMTIGKGDVPEREYMDENIDRLNAKRPGKGAAWASDWRRDRTDKFEPQFRTAFQDASGIRLDEHDPSRYTLIFKTTHMEAGYNVTIKRKSSYIDAEVSVVETDHPEHVIYKFRVTNCKGRSFDGYDFAANLRLMASYAVAGEAVGRTLTGKEID